MALTKLFHFFRRLLTLLFLFGCIHHSRSQDVTITVKKSDPKKYILVYMKYISDKRVTNAFRVFGKTVQIDSNYDEVAKVFTADLTLDIKSNVVFREVISLRRSDIVNLGKFLNSIKQCDSTSFTIEMVDGEKREAFELPDLGQCSQKQLIVDIDNYFRMWYR